MKITIVMSFFSQRISVESSEVADNEHKTLNNTIIISKSVSISIAMQIGIAEFLKSSETRW